MKSSRVVHVHNNSDCDISIAILKPDANANIQLGVPAHSEVVLWEAQMQLSTPLVESAEDFMQHSIEVRAGERKYHIWQQASATGDDRVRCSTDGNWSPPSDANGLPGIPAIELENFQYGLVLEADMQLRGEVAPVDSHDAVQLASPEEEESYVRARSAANDELASGQSSPRGRTHRIDAIFGELDIPRNQPDVNRTFGLTSGNILKPEWVVQTPNCWGMRGKDLRKDHSQNLGNTIRSMILKAERWVDFLLLDPAPILNDDQWLWKSINEPLRQLYRQGRNVTVRILLGQYPGKTSGTGQLLEALVKGLDTGTGHLDLHAGTAEWIQVGAYCWNHSKLLAVDGKYALVGGHNLWDWDYLRWAPVHDLSMQVEGPAAALAHNFCDQLWDEWFRVKAIRIWRDSIDTKERKLVTKVAGPRPMANYPVPPPGPGPTTILAVGRRGGLANAKSNHSTQAIKLALNRATRSIKLSQQDLTSENHYDTEILDALSHAILRGVRVHIVLSADGAHSGEGVSYKNSWGEARFVHRNLSAHTRKLATSGVDVEALLEANLKVASIRFSEDEAWPAGNGRFNGQRRWERKISNHAKMVIVDDRLFYIGAENLYPTIKYTAQAGLQEYGYLVEGEEETRELLEQYWAPLWHWSSRTTVGDPDGGFQHETAHQGGAAAYNPGRANTESFFVGSDKRLRYAFHIVGQVHVDRQSFAQPGDTVGGPVAAVSDLRRRHPGAFFISESGKLHYVFLEGGWKIDNGQVGWTGLASNRSISAIYSHRRQHPEVFCVNRNGKLRYFYSEQGWKSWGFDDAVTISDKPGSISAVFDEKRNHPDLYCLNGDGELIRMFVADSGTWKSQNINRLSGISTRPAGWISALYSRQAERSEIYFVGEDRRLHRLYSEANVWRHDEGLALAGEVTGPIAAVYSEQRKSGELFYRGENGRLCYAFWTDQKWNFDRTGLGLACPVKVAEGAIGASYHPVRRHTEPFVLGEDGKHHGFWVDRRLDVDGIWQHEVWLE